MYMKRALELARRGAGLVSPNPMVGAVLVKEGRAIGEGFHRYDRLRHAESYAIEQAGELARGATLYCNLEPCCHHGRTPPCTDALIEAGIARAIIATSDPDSRVSGHGIEQLRAAGITVEVGLCESQALRLNECYLKFVTTGAPFIHSVVECAETSKSVISEWEPSREFLDLAGEYDMIGLGRDLRINAMVLDDCLSRERHRRLIVIGAARDIEQSTPGIDKINATFIPDEPDDELNAFAQSDLASILKSLAEGFNLTSALTLPGFRSIDSPGALEQCDKVTVVVKRTDGPDSEKLNSICSSIELDTNYANDSVAGNYIELTGYPARNRQE